VATKDLTPKQAAFLDALFDKGIKGDIRAAMRVAGYSNDTAESVIIEALADEIVERSKRLIAAHAAKATLAGIGILDDPTALGSDRTLQVAKELWDRAGIVKRDKLEVSGPEGAAIFFLPMKNPD
jgi:hypothetical protein